MVGHRSLLILASELTLSLSLSLCAPGSPAQEATRLPDVAQAKISATVGSDVPAYYAHPARNGFSLTNSDQDFVTDFSPQGVQVTNGDVTWSLSLLGYGYGEAFLSLAPVVPQSNSNRVEYRRGVLTEWYVNGPAGLEQGFTVGKRPPHSRPEPLTIALSLSGGLSAAVDQDRKGLSLSEPAGRVRMRYAGLTAYDIDGRELRAWLQIDGRRLLLRVDDSGAHYPIVVDPTVQLAKLTSSDGQTGNWLGYSVAISGTTVVIGAPQATVGSNTYQGAAYVFVRPQSGWVDMHETAKLTASDGAPFDYFGGAVAIDGGTVVVGAFDANLNGAPGVGAAYVFVQPVSGWTTTTETAKLTAADGAMNDFFGYSVSVSGNTIVAGEPHAAVGFNYDQGAAYVFVEPGNGWASMTQTAKLTSDGLVGDQFGQSVSISGTTVAVGAPYVALNGNFSQGAAYVFVEPGGGWADMTPTAVLTMAGGLGYQYFGTSVATSGSAVVAGAPGVNSFAGAAFVFAEPASGWANMTQTAELTSSTGVANDLLGTSVAISGNTVVAGASHAQIGVLPWAGAAYLFIMPAGGWVSMTQKARFTVAHGASYQDFGASVSISGNTVAIGGYGVNSYTGAGYVFGNSPAKRSPTFGARQ